MDSFRHGGFFATQGGTLNAFLLLVLSQNPILQLGSHHLRLLTAKLLHGAPETDIVYWELLLSLTIVRGEGKAHDV